MKRKHDFYELIEAERNNNDLAKGNKKGFKNLDNYTNFPHIKVGKTKSKLLPEKTLESFQSH